MNERIEALAKQAAEYAIEFAVKDQELYIPKLMEKFAELIVGECLDACSWAKEIRYFVPPTQDAVVSSCMDMIKRHFGV